MTIKYNVQGNKRKELAQTMADWLGCNVQYKGAPTFAYEVAYFTIDRNGALSFDDRADSRVIERLLEMLYDNGFEAESLPEATTARAMAADFTSADTPPFILRAERSRETKRMSAREFISRTAVRLI